MDTDIDTSEEYETEPVENSYFKCGICKTELSMPNEKLFQATVSAHSCSSSETPWYSHIFNFWGFLVITIIGYVIVKIVVK